MIPAESDLPSLLPALRALSRADKLRVIQDMAVELAKDEAMPMAETGVGYPIWTPHQAFEAAATLLGALEAERKVL